MGSHDESDSYDEDEDESDSEMVRALRGEGGGARNSNGKAKTMQEKLHDILLTQASSRSRANGHVQMSVAQPRYLYHACDLKESLLKKIEDLGKRLPRNTLDQLIDELGGAEHVAEMTGRKGRVVQTEFNEIQYETRAEQGITLEKLNLIEKERFMNGEKLIAIISEAASNGISLQSDRRVKNKLRRVHITLELPWSADRAIQQFGRTHRSNQVNAPEYIFLISNLAGERRFASSVSKRLESLGALTHADRRATETRNLSQFNVDNRYGREALQTVLENIMGQYATQYRAEHIEKTALFNDFRNALVAVDVGEPISSVDMPRFLNRILGLRVDLQNQLFDYFTETLDEAIYKAKKAGQYDLGIMGK